MIMYRYVHTEKKRGVEHGQKKKRLMYRLVHREKKTGRRTWSEKCLMYRYVHTEKKTGRRTWSENVFLGSVSYPASSTSVSLV